MRLYDFQGNSLKDAPSLVYRGMDINKDDSSGVGQLESLMVRGGVPSHALLIREGLFDFERLSKRLGRYEYEEVEGFIEKYLEAIERDAIDPAGIDNDLKGHHLMYYPTSLVSSSSSLVTGTRYSHWIRRPVLVFSTEGLSGVDFKGGPFDNDSEIGIFKKIPVSNLLDVIYFYENPEELRGVLRRYGREDVGLHKGFVRPEFQYTTFCGEKCFGTIPDLRYDDDFLTFCKNKEIELQSPS